MIFLPVEKGTGVWLVPAAAAAFPPPGGPLGGAGKEGSTQIQAAPGRSPVSVARVSARLPSCCSRRRHVLESPVFNHGEKDDTLFSWAICCMILSKSGS